MYVLCSLSETQWRRYLHHWDVLLRGGRLNSIGHLDDGFDQARHIFIHFVIGTIQVGSWARTDLLRLQLDQ